MNIVITVHNFKEFYCESVSKSSVKFTLKKKEMFSIISVYKFISLIAQGTRGVYWTQLAKTAQKMKFSIKDFFSTCDRILDFLITFAEEIINEKLCFLCN